MLGQRDDNWDGRSCRVDWWRVCSGLPKTRRWASVSDRRVVRDTQVKKLGDQGVGRPACNRTAREGPAGILFKRARSVEQYLHLENLRCVCSIRRPGELGEAVL